MMSTTNTRISIINILFLFDEILNIPMDFATVFLKQHIKKIR